MMVNSNILTFLQPVIRLRSSLILVVTRNCRRIRIISFYRPYFLTLRRCSASNVDLPFTRSGVVAIDHYAGTMSSNCQIVPPNPQFSIKQVHVAPCSIEALSPGNNSVFSVTGSSVCRSGSPLRYISFDAPGICHKIITISR